jgi:Ras GTPase-activating-like protein IQGAP2/3
MALTDQQELALAIEEGARDTQEGTLPDSHKRQLYGNLFFLLQTEPRHIAMLARLVQLSEIDTLLQCVMFTLYGNQYDSREEYLLLSMFQNVLAAEFETATEFSNLMRANTPISRMMTTYTRRGPGQSYLKQVLSEAIKSVMKRKQEDLEINPLKVFEEMTKAYEKTNGSPYPQSTSITSEEAAAHPEVQRIIAPRVKKLMDITNEVLNAIFDSIETVPYGIRWICKQIRSLTKVKPKLS